MFKFHLIFQEWFNDALHSPSRSSCESTAAISTSTAVGPSYKWLYYLNVQPCIYDYICIEFHWKMLQWPITFEQSTIATFTFIVSSAFRNPFPNDLKIHYVPILYGPHKWWANLKSKSILRCEKKQRFQAPACQIFPWSLQNYSTVIPNSWPSTPRHFAQISRMHSGGQVNLCLFVNFKNSK